MNRLQMLSQILPTLTSSLQSIRHYQTELWNWNLLKATWFARQMRTTLRQGEKLRIRLLIRNSLLARSKRRFLIQKKKLHLIKMWLSIMKQNWTRQGMNGTQKKSENLTKIALFVLTVSKNTLPTRKSN